MVDVAWLLAPSPTLRIQVGFRGSPVMNLGPPEMCDLSSYSCWFLKWDLRPGVVGSEADCVVLGAS